MRTLTDNEKQKLRWATIFIGAYLVLFCGFKMWTFLHHRRVEYLQLVADADALKSKAKSYQERADAAKQMMENYHLDPAKLTRETIVNEASSAIQKAAAASGIQVGAVRESASRGSGDEIATMQFEGSGPVIAVTGLLNRMQSLGYPLIIDSVQITPDNRPGMMKLSLSIVIINYENWKNPEATHA
ncbi:MAG TPA: hypothetical protein VGF90_01945 [Verrucomicrobiae bacterium]